MSDLDLPTLDFQPSKDAVNMATEYLSLPENVKIHARLAYPGSMLQFLALHPEALPRIKVLTVLIPGQVPHHYSPTYTEVWQEKTKVHLDGAGRVVYTKVNILSSVTIPEECLEGAWNRYGHHWAALFGQIVNHPMALHELNIQFNDNCLFEHGVFMSALASIKVLGRVKASGLGWRSMIRYLAEIMGKKYTGTWLPGTGADRDCMMQVLEPLNGDDLVEDVSMLAIDSD